MSFAYYDKNGGGMRKRVSVFVVFFMIFLFSLTSYAQEITLQASTTQPILGEEFGVTLIMTDLEGGDVQIDGIEVFDVVGRSQSQSIQIIQGTKNMQTNLSLQLRPKSAGDFVLGPARLRGSTTSGSIGTGSQQEVVSNLLKIQVQDVLDITNTKYELPDSGLEKMTETQEESVEGFSRLQNFGIHILRYLLFGGLLLLSGYRLCSDFLFSFSLDE